MAEFGGKDNKIGNILTPYIDESFRELLKGIDFEITPVMALSSKMKALQYTPEAQSIIEEYVNGDNEKAKQILLLLDPKTEDLGKGIYHGLEESTRNAIEELVFAHRVHTQIHNDYSHLPIIDVDSLALKEGVSSPNIIPTEASELVDKLLTSSNKPGTAAKIFQKTFGDGLSPSFFISNPRKTE